MKVLIKIGGTLLDDAASRRSLAHQISRASAAGFTLAVVHGGGKQMTRFLAERGIESRFIRGLRVTNSETIDAVLKVLAGSVNTELVAALGTASVRAVGLTGMDAGIATAEQLDPELGFVGRVTASDPSLLNTLSGAGYVPVIACIAGNPNGTVFNVNGDSMAVAVAAGWRADCLIFMTDVPGVLDADKNVVPELTVEDCGRLIEAGVATGGMQAKLNAAAEAVVRGVHEVRIVKGSDPEILTRTLAGDRTGTKVIAGCLNPRLVKQ